VDESGAYSLYMVSFVDEVLVVVGLGLQEFRVIIIVKAAINNIAFLIGYKGSLYSVNSRGTTFIMLR